MDASIIVALISGAFSVASALGAVVLKDHLESRRRRLATTTSTEPPQAPQKESPLLPEPPLTQATRGSWLRPAAIVFGSILFGMATRLLRTLFEAGDIHYESLAALILLILASLALAVHHRRGRFQFSYQLEVLALWAGWASGWSLIHGGVWDDLLVVAIPWWLGCAIVGGLVVSFRNRPPLRSSVRPAP